MPLLGMPLLGTMMEIELDMLVDYLKLKNIKLVETHKMVNTIGKKSKDVINAKLFIMLDTTTKVVGLQYKMESYIELNGGYHQIVHPQLMQFGKESELAMDHLLQSQDVLQLLP
jgi:hypothetical protein